MIAENWKLRRAMCKAAEKPSNRPIGSLLIAALKQVTEDNPEGLLECVAVCQALENLLHSAGLPIYGSDGLTPEEKQEFLTLVANSIDPFA